MSQVSQDPLVLVVDDNEEFREEVIPEALGHLNARVLTAKDVDEACLVVAKHDDRSDNPLHLIVLDLHMPLREDKKGIKADAGIQFLRSYRLTTCPVVVFTAYPSCRSCVAAVQAGAAAYLPKMTQETYDDEGPEGGIDQLVDICRSLLKRPKAAETPAHPDDDWLNRNYDWLCQEFGGRWIAFVDPEPAGAAELAGTEHEGLLIVGDESQENLKRTIVAKLPLLGTIPPIVFVPKEGSDILD